MPELATLEPAALPVERTYRPITRKQWYSRSLPIGIGLGVGLGALAAFNTLGFWWFILVIYLVLIIRLMGRRRSMQKLLRDNDDALAVLAAGDVGSAGDMFEGLCRTSRSMPALHSLFVYNRGVTYLRSGQPERARSLFAAVLEAGWLSGRKSSLGIFYPNVLAGMATCEALGGDLDAADDWLKQAHDRLSRAKSGSLLLVDALVGARRGAFDRTIRAIDDGWTRAENLLTASQLRSLRLLKAFSLEGLASSQYRAEAHEHDVRDALEGTRPFRKGEFDYLTRGWPEFREFLVRHDYVDPSATER